MKFHQMNEMDCVSLSEYLGSQCTLKSRGRIIEEIQGVSIGSCVLCAKATGFGNNATSRGFSKMLLYD